MTENILGFEIAGNEAWRIGAVFCILLVAFVIGKVVSHIMARGARQDEAAHRAVTLAKLMLRSFSAPATLLIFTVGLNIAFLFLAMSERVRAGADTLVELLVSVSIAYFLYRMVDVAEYYLNQYTASTENTLDDMIVPMIRKTVRVVIVIIVGLYVAESVSGKPMSSIIAGLGLGGLAFALAAQDSIKNFFGSIMILLDKPFSVGDRIVIDGHDGPVEEVGFRSTKIRTLTGHIVTVPNERMVSSTVENIGRRPHIRRTMNLTVTYDTPPDKIERAVEIIEGILKDHEGMKPGFPPRVFFSDFNDWALNIRVIYWYHPPNYWDYCAFSQGVNLKIMRAFEDEGIEFAFPTQTMYLAGDEKRQLTLKMLEKGLDE